MTAGAVYNPVAEMLPTAGLTDQVTAVLPAPVVAAVNCVPPAINTASGGLTDTAVVELSFTVAFTDLEGSATLVAVMVTTCAVAMMGSGI